MGGEMTEWTPSGWFFIHFWQVTDDLYLHINLVKRTRFKLLILTVYNIAYTFYYSQDCIVYYSLL